MNPDEWLRFGRDLWELLGLVMWAVWRLVLDIGAIILLVAAVWLFFLI